VVENDDSEWHDRDTVQLDYRARPDVNTEHVQLSASPSNASLCGSTLLSDDGQNAPVLSDIEAQCPSDADMLDFDDEHGLSPPASRCGMSVISGYGDTSSWTQDDDSASSGNELLRQLEAYTHGDDRSVDEFVINGAIPSLEDFLAADRHQGSIET